MKQVEIIDRALAALEKKSNDPELPSAVKSALVTTSVIIDKYGFRSTQSGYSEKFNMSCEGVDDLINIELYSKIMRSMVGVYFLIRKSKMHTSPNLLSKGEIHPGVAEIMKRSNYFEVFVFPGLYFEMVRGVYEPVKKPQTP